LRMSEQKNTKSYHLISKEKYKTYIRLFNDKVIIET
jgi:hypothetical protein